MLGHERRLRRIKKELRIAFYPQAVAIKKSKKNNPDGVAFSLKI